jgi:hypothetical protein
VVVGSNPAAPTNYPGWKNDQIANVSDVTVNDDTWVPKTTETSTSSVTGDFAKTCTLPAAEPVGQERCNADRRRQ